MKARLMFLFAVAAVATVALVSAAGGAGRGQLYSFGGKLLTTPGAGASSVSVQVETGDRAALQKLIGQSQDQAFALGKDTEILVWSNGVPKVASSADLQAGDFVTVRVRAPHDATLAEIEGKDAAVVSDRGANPQSEGQPLWLFIGTVAGPQSGGKIALHVSSGNWKALHAMLGQPLDETFTYDDGTIFLLWQGRVPTVIDASQLKAGDRITVRIHAARGASLAQIEGIAASHVGDHEPAPPAES